jgi:succinate dehydrogenase/fumarate reductase cytochrome b subunit
MDQIVGVMTFIIVHVFVMGMGRKILKLFGRSDASNKAVETVGAAFWLAVGVGVYFIVRTCL